MSPRGGWVSCVTIVSLGWGCGPKVAPSPSSTSPDDAPSSAPETASAPPPEGIHPRDRPELTITLPPSPDFERPGVPHVYDDGSYSVAGIRADLDARVSEGERGEPIVVWAYVREIYAGPDCSGEPTCPRKQPHFWVVDAPGDRSRIGAMMVANHEFTIPQWDSDQWKDEPAVELSEGQRYRFRARVTRHSDSGFAATDGLLEFIAVEAPDASGQPRWIFPPGAPWHPRTLAAQDEANRALAEAAERSALEARKRDKKKRSKPRKR